ncbi:acyl-CoA dehydratase activase [Thermodesulfobacteriota bacterium]
MVFAGLDVGSRSIELVFLKGGEITLFRRVDTGFNPLPQCRKMLDGLRWNRLVATGYGRKLIASQLEADTITEIQAYGLGARFFFPACATVLDIGGQDTKVIALSSGGRVTKFEMNDRCAAGTGKFLEFMAASLSLPLSEFGRFALSGAPGITINSMCTVFAETEATSLMAQGRRAQDIALALHYSVVRRSVAMLKRVGLEPPMVFAGGVARNPCIARLVREATGMDILIPHQPDMVGALGAALFGLHKGAEGSKRTGQHHVSERRPAFPRLR